MKLSNLFETRNPGYRPGQPYWELDAENKVYTVHEPDGTEVARHPFEHIWDSSPAMRKAKADYDKVYEIYYKKKKADEYAEAQAKPLGVSEKKDIMN